MSDTNTGRPTCTEIHVGGTLDVWTIIPELPGFVMVKGEEEPEDVILIDALHMKLYVGPECSWHSLGHAIELVEKISRKGRTFENVNISLGRKRGAQ